MNNVFKRITPATERYLITPGKCNIYRRLSRIHYTEYRIPNFEKILNKEYTITKEAAVERNCSMVLNIRTNLKINFGSFSQFLQLPNYVTGDFSLRSK
jgi:hypothetical protein